MRKYNQEPPVKPIGRILYHEYISDHWFHEKPGNRNKEQPLTTYDRLCDCKGFSDDRPFSVFFHKDPKDKRPFKVVFHWTNEKYKSFKFSYMGSTRTEIDSDTYHMMDVLEEHVTKTAAQAAMRRFAKEAFDKVNYPPAGEGAVCHNRIGGWDNDVEQGVHPVRVGDLVHYTGIPDALWRVAGERRKDSRWYLKIVPVYNFLSSLIDGPKAREILPNDCVNMLYPVDLVQLGTTYANLANLMKDEAERLAR